MITAVATIPPDSPRPESGAARWLHVCKIDRFGWLTPWFCPQTGRTGAGAKSGKMAQNGRSSVLVNTGISQRTRGGHYKPGTARSIGLSTKEASRLW